MAFALPVAMGLGLAGGAMGAFSSITGGQAQGSMYDYRAGVARANQQISAQNAAYEIQGGEDRALISGERSRFRAGGIAVAQGASGVDVNRGSAPLVRSGQNIIAQQDQSIIRSNAGRLAYGQEVKGAEYGAEATTETLAGEHARTAGDIGAVTSLIGAASSVAGKWYQGTQAGMSGGGNAQNYTEDVFS